CPAGRSSGRGLEPVRGDGDARRRVVRAGGGGRHRSGGRVRTMTLRPVTGTVSPGWSESPASTVPSVSSTTSQLSPYAAGGTVNSGSAGGALGRGRSEAGTVGRRRRA